MLQGDFLLTANREGVLDNSWNRALREACPDAFVKAIHHLNSGSERYTWTKYLPGQDISDFFEPLRDLILGRLSKEPILQAHSGRMVAPSMLTYIPHGHFSDVYGRPMTLSSQTLDLYVSSKYPKCASASLSRLGTQTIDARGFLEHLDWIISNDPQGFRGRHRKWHSQLAGVLLSLVNNNKHLELIKGLEIIPLSNGQWIAAKAGPIYSSQGAKTLPIPHTIPIHIINPAAERDSRRHNLFVRLSVKPRPDAADVCRLIIEMHRDHSFKPETLTPNDLVEHVVFMFGASFDIPPNTDLWFATEDDKRAKGSSLYMRSSAQARPFKNRIREHVEANYPLLHKAYAEALQVYGPEKSTWRRWIQRCLGVRLSNLPRICVGAPDGLSKGSLRLSAEFKSLFKELDSPDVLDLLRVRWDEYSGSIKERYRVGGNDWNNPLRDEIAAMKVQCAMASTDICFLPLRDTLLPKLDETIDKGSCLPLLVVSDPANQEWKFLRTFGVSVDRNLKYYLRCLAALKGYATKPLKAIVAHIYKGVEAEYMCNRREIWSVYSTAASIVLINIRCSHKFMKEPLIYTSLGLSDGDSNMRWITAQECLEQDLNITAEYQRSASLFRNILGAGTNEIEIERIFQTLCAITEQTSLSDILKLFVKMSRALQAQGAENFKAYIERLKGWIPIFPILQRNGDKEYDTLAPLNPEFPPWFIADRHDLRDSFCGCVGILAFLPEDLHSIEHFLSVFDLKLRFLSRIVEIESSPIGKPKRHKTYTLTIRRKAAFITRQVFSFRPDSIHACLSPSEPRSSADHYAVL